MTASAIVRSSRGEWRSDSRAENSTSPMIDETGVITGWATSGGSSLDTMTSRSLTACLAR